MLDLLIALLLTYLALAVYIFATLTLYKLIKFEGETSNEPDTVELLISSAWFLVGLCAFSLVLHTELQE